MRTPAVNINLDLCFATALKCDQRLAATLLGDRCDNRDDTNDKAAAAQPSPRGLAPTTIGLLPWGLLCSRRTRTCCSNRPSPGTLRAHRLAKLGKPAATNAPYPTTSGNEAEFADCAATCELRAVSLISQLLAEPSPSPRTTDEACEQRAQSCTHVYATPPNFHRISHKPPLAVGMQTTTRTKCMQTTRTLSCSPAVQGAASLCAPIPKEASRVAEKEGTQTPRSRTRMASLSATPESPSSTSAHRKGARQRPKRLSTTHSHVRVACGRHERSDKSPLGRSGACPM